MTEVVSDMHVDVISQTPSTRGGSGGLVPLRQPRQMAAVKAQNDPAQRRCHAVLRHEKL